MNSFYFYETNISLFDSRKILRSGLCDARALSGPLDGDEVHWLLPNLTAGPRKNWDVEEMLQGRNHFFCSFFNFKPGSIWPVSFRVFVHRQEDQNLYIILSLRTCPQGRPLLPIFGVATSGRSRNASVVAVVGHGKGMEKSRNSSACGLSANFFDFVCRK